MPRLTDKAWSPYVAGALIGLLQIPAFIFLGTALGASSSYVTLSASLAEFFDAGIRALRYAAGHLDGAKNWWQVALVFGIALGAFASATNSSPHPNAPPRSGGPGCRDQRIPPATR